MLTSDEKNQIYMAVAEQFVKFVSERAPETVIRCLQECGGLDHILELPSNMGVAFHITFHMGVDELSQFLTKPKPENQSCEDHSNLSSLTLALEL